MRLVDEAVENGIPQRGIIDPAVPEVHGKLTGNQRGAGAGPVVDEFEQVVASRLIQRGDSPVVEDEQIGPGQLGEGFTEAAIAMRHPEVFQEARQAREQDREALATRLLTEGAGQPGLAGAGGTADQEGLTVAPPVPLGKRGDQTGVESPTRTRIQVFKTGLGELEFGLFEQAFPALVVAPGGLAIDQEAETLLEGQAGGSGQGQLFLESARHAIEPEGFELGEGVVGQHRKESWSSVVVIGTAHMFVLRVDPVGLAGRGGQRLPVEARLKNGKDRAPGPRPDRYGAGTGGFQAIFAVAAGQGHQPQAGAIAHLRMGLVGQLVLHQGAGLGADLLRPVQQAARGPRLMGAMRLGHVFGQGGMGSAPIAAGMTSHPAATGEDFHGGGGNAGLHLLPHQGMGHAVVMTVDFNVIIDVDAAALEVGDLVRQRRQGLEGGPVQRFEPGLTVALKFLEGALVQFDHYSGYRPHSIQKSHILSMT